MSGFGKRVHIVADRGRIYSAGIYARLSVDSHNEKNESVENQIAIARAFLQKHPEIVLFDCYVDLGRTGTNFDREEFARLMRDVRLQKVDCILVKDFSRFGRNYLETGDYIQKIFPFLGVRFIAVADSFDSLCAKADELSVNLLNLTNEMYARDISLKVKSSRRLWKEAGIYAGGKPPYGYRTSFLCGKRSLVADGKAAQVVDWLFRMCAQGKSQGEMRRSLYEEKIHSPGAYAKYGHVRAERGEEILEWPRASLRTLLTNPVYTGRPEGAEEAGPGENAHEAIITAERFVQAQKALDGRKRQRSGHCGSGTGECCDIFEGILFCGECGKKMGRKSGRKPDASDAGARSYGYFCRGSLRMDCRFCESKYVSERKLIELTEAALETVFLMEGKGPEELLRLKAAVWEQRKKRREEKDRRLEQDRAALQRRGCELYEKYRSEQMSRKDFIYQSGEIKKRRRELDRKQAGKREGQETGREEHGKLHDLKARKADRDRIRAFIEKICIYREKRIEITFRFREREPSPESDGLFPV